MNSAATIRAADLAGASLTLRVATAEDLPFLRTLFASVRGPEFAASGWPDDVTRAFCDSQYALQDRHYREHFAGAQCLVVLAGSTPIGRIYRAIDEETLYLLDIALVASARGHGIGTTLMRALTEEAERNARDIVLHVEPANPAMRLYERLGFVAGAKDGVYCEMRRRPARSAPNSGG